ncbi:hypothetical protein ACWDBP_42595 [Streptomyces sp. NPDC001233]
MTGSRITALSHHQPSRVLTVDDLAAWSTPATHDRLTAKLRAAGLGAIADLGFIGLDDSGPDADPAVISAYKAARNRLLIRGQKQANQALAAVRARSSTASRT